MQSHGAHAARVGDCPPATRAAPAYRAAGSSLDAERPQEAIRKRRVEIVGDANLALESAKSLSASAGRHCDQFHERLAVLRDDDVFACRGFVDQARQMGLGGVQVHGLHGLSLAKSKSSVKTLPA